MDIELVIAGVGADHKPKVHEAILAFNSTQTSYRLIARENDVLLPWPRVISWPDFRATLRPDPNGAARMFVTDSPFKDNWFSHCESRLKVVSMDQWFQLFQLDAPLPLQSYLLMSFALGAMFFTIGLDEEAIKWHENPVGCMLDFCGRKPDTLIRLRAGYLCPQHRQNLLVLNASETQVAAMQRVAELARAYALGREDEKRRLGAARGRKIFVVHGRNEPARAELTDVLVRLGFEAIAIINEPVQGTTVIEQIESYSGVGFAVILFTPDDRGCLRGAKRSKPRPRQNVVFEYGLFVGWLGRRRVCCIAPSSEIEAPSDLAGVLQLRYESSVAEVETRLRQELISVGYMT